MDAQPSFISIDTFHSDAFPAGALGLSLPMSDQKTAAHSAEAWTDDLARSLQAQHGRVREFLDRQRRRWQQASAEFHRQIESLEGEARDLRTRNDELQRQLSDAPATRAATSSQPSAARAKPQAVNAANDWEAQKRRMLASLEPDDRNDAIAPADSLQQRTAIDEIVRRTDRIIAEKDREIEELRSQLAIQSCSLTTQASDAAAALGEVFDRDEIIRQERVRLQQLQGECREKLRSAEIAVAVERATLARREAELADRLRAADLRRSAADADGATLAPTGRPIRGRWRAQMGLGEDT